MPPLQFRFVDIISELHTIHKLAAPLISTDSRGILKELWEKLESFSAARTESEFDWEIRQQRPIRTNASKGKYECGGRIGSHTVTAEITAKWQIRNVADGSTRRAAKLF